MDTIRERIIEEKIDKILDSLSYEEFEDKLDEIIKENCL